MDTEHAILDYSTDGNMIAALSFEDWDTGSELDFEFQHNENYS